MVQASVLITSSIDLTTDDNKAVITSSVAAAAGVDVTAVTSLTVTKQQMPSRRRARQLAGEEAAYDVAYEIELLTAAAPALVANLENVTAFGATLVAELKKVDVFTADPAITAVASPDVVYVEETEPPTDPSILSSCDARASLSALLSLLSCALLLLYPHW